MVTADGTNTRRLTSSPSLFTLDGSPWSPDSKSILVNGPYSNLGLSEIRADGRGRRHIPHTADAAFGGNPDAQPVWSKDGRRIYYIAATRAGTSLFETNAADGSGKRNLTPTLHRVYSFTVSPNAQMIAVVAEPNDAVGFSNARDIFLINRDGRTIRRLDNPRRKNDGDPSWSPDGTVLAFTRRWTLPRPSSHIYLANADGTALEDISRNNNNDTFWQWQTTARPS